METLGDLLAWFNPLLIRNQSLRGSFFMHLLIFFSGVDQYLAILDPLEYPFKVTKVVSWQMISLVWALSLTSSMGTAFQMVTAASQSPW